MRQARFVGVAELATEAAKILAESGPAQARGTVTELPDERTVRYYQTEGLLSPAEDKQGTASVFSYRHLLELLVVKKLQSEHLPIRKIRSLVDGRTERELERLLGSEGSTAVKNEALSYLEKLLMQPTPVQPPAQASQPQQQQALPQSSSSGQAQVGRIQFAPQSPTTSSGGHGTWARIEIEPGLELHVSDQYQPPREARGLRRLTQSVLRVIESYSRKQRK
ncbi:MAG TPA: MerR family transcriptional regulator [Pyrinomonadaceae bacterium]|nr:MerR family transcriptional regulator [Pyrinomonadaceae bacterium]